MSLTSRKSIRKAGPDKHQEKIVSFRREEDKSYTKITKEITRDWKTGGIRKTKKNVSVEQGPYELVSGPEVFDEKIAYEDIDGSTKFLYLKKSKDFKSKEVDEPEEDE